MKKILSSLTLILCLFTPFTLYADSGKVIAFPGLKSLTCQNALQKNPYRNSSVLNFNESKEPTYLKPDEFFSLYEGELSQLFAFTPEKRLKDYQNKPFFTSRDRGKWSLFNDSPIDLNSDLYLLSGTKTSSHTRLGLPIQPQSYTKVKLSSTTAAFYRVIQTIREISHHPTYLNSVNFKFIEWRTEMRQMLEILETWQPADDEEESLKAQIQHSLKNPKYDLDRNKDVIDLFQEILKSLNSSYLKDYEDFYDITWDLITELENFGVYPRAEL